MNIQKNKKVLLLIDFENVFFSLFAVFGPDKMNLDHRFQKLVEWIGTELGEILDGYGFIFAPSHFSAYHRETCVKNNLRIMICPKRKAKVKGEKEEDTVDENIIWFGRMMIRHPDVELICLVSGDEDFAPLLEEAKKNGVKIALGVPTLNCLSTNKTMAGLIDCHPKTGKKMVFMLDQV